VQSRLSFEVPEQIVRVINPLNAELNPICHLLALLGAHHVIHVSRIRVKELNTDTTARIRTNNQTSRPITIKNGVRQGDSLSPVLFNLIMDKIIVNLPKELGYRMGNDPIHIICYADEAVLIADSEENLQTLLLRFEFKT
jgi:hypothetical protein